MMTILLHKTWIYQTSQEGEALMRLPLWALFSLMPGRSAIKTSSTTITTTTPVAASKYATLSSCKLPMSEPKCKGAKLPSCRADKLLICQTAELQYAKLPTCKITTYSCQAA
jgi:hypothetical protein